MRSYVDRHAPEILEQFELVLNTLSMEEAIAQVERLEEAVAVPVDPEEVVVENPLRRREDTAH